MLERTDKGIGLASGCGIRSKSRAPNPIRNSRHHYRETTAIYAHLDDIDLRNAAAQAASVITHVMGYRAEPPLLLGAADRGAGVGDVPGARSAAASLAMLKIGEFTQMLVSGAEQVRSSASTRLR